MLKPRPLLRPATLPDTAALATIWYHAWKESHEHLLPPDLIAHRTRDSFLERMPSLLPDTVVATVEETPVGFCTIHVDELYQLFVDRSARGTGVAGLLLADAECRLASRGVATAWLSCAIGNDRAGRFYEKCGWQRVGTMITSAYTAQGAYPLETWRYEKRLRDR